MDLKGKVVTVVGLAKSGRAAAVLAHRVGAVVRVTDQGSQENIEPSFRAWLAQQQIVSEFGGHTEPFIAGSDLVIVSPGVRFDAQPIQWARAHNISVIGEMEFAFRFCACPVIAVTGSNGKTTVTTLIGRVLDASGKKVFVGGNIGTPFSEAVLDLTVENVAVLEVSSFQLETIEQFHAHAAVFLNLSQNHLDRHADMEEYFTAKAKIFVNQNSRDFAVLNSQDGSMVSLASCLDAQVRWFNTKEQIARTGFDNPNFLAVEAVASALNIDPACIRKVFNEFQGIEHRMEVVRKINNVVFINDSKSTTTEASRWALTRAEGPIVWICGGRDKNLDFSVLSDIVRRKVKKIIAIGEAAAKIRDTYADFMDVECFGNFEQAIIKAFESAQSGDIVLLSPMCASFDMFKNFEHRGKEFKQIVNNL